MSPRAPVARRRFLAENAMGVGSIALALILFDGGLRTRLATFRNVLGPASMLATLGVLLTAALTAPVALGSDVTRHVSWSVDRGRHQVELWRVEDGVLVFKRAGDNAVPVTHPTGLNRYAGSRKIPSDLYEFKGFKGKQTGNRFSHWIWRHYASCFWDDIRLSRVLPYLEAKGEQDERHQHPLQLDVIERSCVLWTNPGEIAGDGIDNDANGFIDDIHGWNFSGKNNNSRDDHDHGSHCSGTIGGVGNNDLGIVGVNWEVSIVGIKFLTGAGSGIGRATALALAKDGYRVVLTGRRREPLEEAAAEAKGAKTLIVTGDVSKSADVARMFSETVAAFAHHEPVALRAFDRLPAIRDLYRHHLPDRTKALGLLVELRQKKGP